MDDDSSLVLWVVSSRSLLNYKVMIPSDDLKGVALAALLPFIWMLTLRQSWLHDDAPAPSEAFHELRCDDGLFWTL